MSKCQPPWVAPLLFNLDRDMRTRVLTNPSNDMVQAQWTQWWPPVRVTPPIVPPSLQPSHQCTKQILRDSLQTVYLINGCNNNTTICFSTYLPNVHGGRRPVMLCCMQVDVFSQMFTRDFSMMHWLTWVIYLKHPNCGIEIWYLIWPNRSQFN